jgi:hypothetical protein
MIKKKAKSKTGAKKPGKKKGEAKPKPETNPAEVRKEVSKLVKAHAAEMTEAVIVEGEKGQLAPVRYLFEMASIFPPEANGEQATPEEDCLAKMLLDRIGPPPKKEEEGGTGSEVAAEGPTPAKGSGQALAAKTAATMGQPAPTAQPAKDEDGSGGKNSEREDGKAEAAHTAKEALVTG